MAEIKLNDGFSAEVEAFRAAGEALDSSDMGIVIPDGGGLSLETAKAYQERMPKIYNLMTKLRMLVVKDTADMDALAASLKAADEAGGGAS